MKKAGGSALGPQQGRRGAVDEQLRREAPGFGSIAGQVGRIVIQPVATGCLNHGPRGFPKSKYGPVGQGPESRGASPRDARGAPDKTHDRWRTLQRETHEDADTRARPGRAAARGGGPGPGDGRPRPLQGPHRQRLRPRSQGSYAAGAKSPMHSHPDAMLVALGDAKAPFTMPDGKTQVVELKKDTAIYTPAFTHRSPTGTTPGRRHPRGVQGEGAGHGHAADPARGNADDGPRREPARRGLQDHCRAGLPRGRRARPTTSTRW